MEPLQTQITIKSIVPSDKVPVFNVETMEGEKYQFWRTKKDGTNTLAYQQFEEKRFIGGDKLAIFYNEVPGKPYINKFTNKEVTPTNRIITKFIMDGEGNPAVTMSPQAPQAPLHISNEQNTQSATPNPIQQSHANFELIMANLRKDIAGGFKKRDDLIETLLERVAILEEQLEKLLKPKDETFNAEKMSEQDKKMANALGIDLEIPIIK